ncbi:MAG: tripartite tricarboxylate transporter permease [archaeon]|nr:tripartite tricarboxylate transporter permease [archaeon]MCR4323840.1 tripartite tricarboxylate transporter permease [Nanoarchaeota archaeon]
MIIELFLFTLLGIVAGTFTGLIPGIHINLVATTILFSPLILKISPTNFIIFITSMAITHTFIDFIPSIFLGAPDEDTGLGVLPGHKLLLRGHGHHALRLTLIGSTLAIISLIIIVPLFILLIPIIYPFLQRMMAFFLIWIVIFLLLGEREAKIKSLIIFLLVGFFGLASLNLNLDQPLLPMLTGLFGSSTLLASIKSGIKVPPQETKKIPILKKELIKPTIITLLVSPLCSLFPGLGSSQAAVIGSRIGGKLNREQFLILLGSINTLVISISFVTLFLLQKTRTGAVVALNQITNIGLRELIIIFSVIAISTMMVYPLTITLSKIFARNIHKISYTKISITILIVLTIIVTVFSGFLGLLVFFIATTIGLTCIELQVRRSFLMGALLVPTILFYIPFF